jgi:transposase InsO family protein
LCRDRRPEDDQGRSGLRFVSRDLDLWAYAKGITLDLSRPGKPTDNAFIEAFNGRLRAECLTAHWFLILCRTPSNPGTAEWKNSGQRSVDREDRLFRGEEAVMEWVLKLETRNGWGEMETIEVGRLERRVVGLTAEQLGLTLAEAKSVLGELGRLVLQCQSALNFDPRLEWAP